MKFEQFLAQVGAGLFIGLAILIGMRLADWLIPEPPTIVEFRVEQTDEKTLCNTP